MAIKHDQLSALPPELGLYILSFVDNPITLLKVGAVSRKWFELSRNEGLWVRLCKLWEFRVGADRDRCRDEPLEEMEPFAEIPMDPALEWIRGKHKGKVSEPSTVPFSYLAHFKKSYTKIIHWRNSGHLLRAHQLPMASTVTLRPPPPSPPRSPARGTTSSESSVVTSLALDSEWIVVGLASSRIHIFSAHTGVLARTLVGHEAGVWCVALISAGGKRTHSSRRREGPELYHALPSTLRAAVGLDDEEDVTPPPSDPGTSEPYSYYALEPQSSPSFASHGWGQPNALVVSGGCDKVVRVWDVISGHCIYVLRGHTSTIRCLRTLHSRSVAVTGARDGTLRTWDVQRGAEGHVLEGHEGAVRCVDVNGIRAVSGGYDACARVWDLDTGECIHVLRGHFNRIYSVAFDGERIATGSMDTSIRVWDAETGHCLALLQDHRALVCQLQISRKHQLLLSGNSDGGVVAFSLSSRDGDGVEELMGRVPALASSSVTAVEGGKMKQQKEQQNVSSNGHLEPLKSKRTLVKDTSHDSDGLLSVSSRSSSSSSISRPSSPALSHRAYTSIYRILPNSLHAHKSSITSIQFNARFLLTSSNDGCVHLWETMTGRWVRRLSGKGVEGWDGPVFKAGFDYVEREGGDEQGVIEERGKGGDGDGEVGE
ncbi:hypothetical protein H0H87_003284, partial [Tephrocybe sp. NHM501043]